MINQIKEGLKQRHMTDEAMPSDDPCRRIGLLLVMALCFFPFTSLAADEGEDYLQVIQQYNQHAWDDARRLCEKFLVDYPKSRWKSAVRLRQADMESNIERAISLYEAVLQDEVRGEWAVDGHWGLARTHYSLGHYAQAALHYQAVANAAGAWQVPALLQEGSCYLLVAKPEAAKNIFLRVLDEFEAHPAAAKALIGLGEAELRLKNVQDAIGYFDRYLRRFPEGEFASLALDRKAQALQAQGSGDEANRVFHELATRFPESLEAKQVQTRLNDDQTPVTIQVGAFSNSEYASRLKKRLRNKGYNAYIVKALSGKVYLHQVRVGNYTRRDFAETIAKKLEKTEKLPYLITPYVKPDKD